MRGYSEVAIKVLPASFRPRPRPPSAFSAAAQAVAALNLSQHPRHSRLRRTRRPTYIVIGLLEGETLRERMRPGSLPVRKAVEYAEQVARRLAAAPEMAIVDRV